MANPDVRVRESLFDFIQKHDFVLTDEGYMLVYKTVNYATKVENDLPSFVSNNYLKVKKDWKTSASKYVVYKQFSDTIQHNGEIEYDLEDCDSYDEYIEYYGYEPDTIDDSTEIISTFEYKLTKKTTFNNWNVKEKQVELVGSLNDLQENLDNLIEDEISIFTDKYSGTMKIILGTPVKMNRTNCDSNPQKDCSYGLHVGATKYVEKFTNYNPINDESPVLVCLVNPMNVVAVPDYDHSKMRVTEYFPMALATVNNNKIDIVTQSFFESDYKSHEEEELGKLLRSIKEEELRQTAINADEDDRSLDDYIHILESRVVDLSKK